MPSGDHTESPAANPAAAPDPAAAPAAAPESPAAVPVAEPTEARPEAPAIVEQPAGEPSPPESETPPAIEAEKPGLPELKLHTEKPTLMELAGKEAEQPKPEGDAPAPAEPAAPRSYEPFTLPEDLTVDQARMTEAATNLFAADNLSQERAQAYVDFHIAELQRLAHAERQANQDAFADLRSQWVEQVMADPEIGGNRHQTALKSIALARDLFVSNAPSTSEKYQQEMTEFNDFLRTTGAGDHPAFNRLLHNVARKFQESAAPTITFKPPPDIGKRPNGAANRRETLYARVDTTPRS